MVKLRKEKSNGRIVFVQGWSLYYKTYSYLHIYVGNFLMHSISFLIIMWKSKNAFFFWRCIPERIHYILNTNHSEWCPIDCVIFLFRRCIFWTFHEIYSQLISLVEISKIHSMKFWHDFKILCHLCMSDTSGDASSK